MSAAPLQCLERRDTPTPRFAPGAADARAHGCQCPAMDNAHGRGIDSGLRTLFWVSSDCPLHGARVPPPDAAQPGE